MRVTHLRQQRAITSTRRALCSSGSSRRSRVGFLRRCVQQEEGGTFVFRQEGVYAQHVSRCLASAHLNLESSVCWIQCRRKLEAR